VSPCEQYSLGEIATTKMKFENQQRAITQKNKKCRAAVSVHFTSYQ
jgi:hypothetical protein